eukprot:TRINITY_DN3405_c0_g1_i3.p1 TRINITY_DN3405_c0_g1~~TRINITY_DN3405_c0_g1_i3.p1  ORF type:complete len:449 (+),score=80.03 TRINITY_DN3405_c0_g1_i3:644-1990(+)
MNSQTSFSVPTMRTIDEEENIVSKVISVYSPWIFSQKTQHVTSLPWRETQISHAGTMLSSFVQMIIALQSKMASPICMRKVFDTLTEKIFLIPTNPDFVISHYGTHLITLPWSSHVATTNSPKTFLNLVQILSTSSLNLFKFLVEIVTTVSWQVPDKFRAGEYYEQLFLLLWNITLHYQLPIPKKWSEFLFLMIANHPQWSYYLVSQDIFNNPSVTVPLKKNNALFERLPPEDQTYEFGSDPNIEKMEITKESMRFSLLLRFLYFCVVGMGPVSSPSIEFYQLRFKNIQEYLAILTETIVKCFHPSHGHVAHQFLFRIIENELDPLILNVETDVLSLQRAPFAQICCLVSQILVLFDYELSAESTKMLDEEVANFVTRHPYLSMAVLKATQTSIQNPEAQLNILEHCLTTDYKLFSNWERLTDMLQVNQNKTKKKNLGKNKIPSFPGK